MCCAMKKLAALAHTRQKAVLSRKAGREFAEAPPESNPSGASAAIH
jgi:hypothetical protein